MDPIQVIFDFLDWLFGVKRAAAKDDTSAQGGFVLDASTIYAATGKMPSGNPALPGVMNQYWATIEEAARAHDLDATILAAQLYVESAGRATITGDSGDSRGIAQINRIAHPEVSDEQAFNPGFGIRFMAYQVALDRDYFKAHYPGINATMAGISAYNCGRGGVIRAINGNLSPEAYTYKGKYYSTVINTALGWYNA